MFNFKLSGWLLGIAIVIAVALYMFGTYDVLTLEAILGFIGVGGLAGLRAYINSSGYKSFIIAGLGMIATALFAFGVIDQATWHTIYVSVLGIATGTLGAAINKTPRNFSAIKK